MCKLFCLPVVILSATLPQKTKRKLLKAAGCKVKKEELDNGYPLITTVRDGKLQQSTISTNGRTIKLDLKRTKDVLGSMYEIALKHKDGCLMLIQKSVDDAINLYKMLEESEAFNDTQLYILHGRDPETPKSNKRNTIIRAFGKDGKKEGARPRKAIIVTTSIAEQSLDIDVDYMATALCPIDLLIQRIGRYRRHDDKGTVRENNKDDDHVIVLAPESLRGLVYDEQVLKLTLDVLERTNEFNTTLDVRNMIDDVYNAVDETRFARESGMGLQNVIYRPDAQENLTFMKEEYNAFRDSQAKTRLAKYRTEKICILKSEAEVNDSFEFAKKLHEQYIVSIPWKYIENESYKTYSNTKWLRDIYFFFDANEEAKTSYGSLKLTYRGMEINRGGREK